MRDNKGDNRGYSLVELIIVLAILSIFTAFMTYSFGMVSGKYARQCANNIGTALDKAKNYAMIRSGSIDAYLVIRQDSKGYVAEYYLPNSPITTDPTDCFMVDSETAGRKTVAVTCVLQDGNEIPIEGSTKLYVFFDRITGAFKEVKVSDDAGDTIEYCDGIRVQYGKKFYLRFITNTGKHEVIKM